MPKYHFLYHNNLTLGFIFQSDHTAPTEQEARKHIKKFYNADLLCIRKGKPYSKIEIEKKKKALRYG